MLKRIYVWELPVRLTHWINVISIVLLSFTGFYIGRPFIHAIHTSQYYVGWMRFIHLTIGYVFLISCLVRLYWSFAGNQYASWRVYNPFSIKKVKELVGITKFYLLIDEEHQPVVGHSACATYVYGGLFVLYIIEFLSGFALTSQSYPHSVLWTVLGGWVLLIFDAQTVRLYHHFVMWLMIAFAILHIYISVFLESKERSGMLTSIFSGYKTMG